MLSDICQENAFISCFHSHCIGRYERVDCCFFCCPFFAFTNCQRSIIGFIEVSTRIISAFMYSRSRRSSTCSVYCRTSVSNTTLISLRQKVSILKQSIRKISVVVGWGTEPHFYKFFFECVFLQQLESTSPTHFLSVIHSTSVFTYRISICNSFWINCCTQWKILFILKWKKLVFKCIFCERYSW